MKQLVEREVVHVTLQQCRRHNEPHPDSQFLKSVKLDVSTYDGCLHSQFFLIGPKTRIITSYVICYLRLERSNLLNETYWIG